MGLLVDLDVDGDIGTSVYWGKKLEGFELPGKGEAYGTCIMYAYRGCLEKHTHEVIIGHGAKLNGLSISKEYLTKAPIWKARNKCFRVECPECYEDWAAREAGAGEYRLKLAKEKHQFLSRSKPIHVCVSVPESDYEVFRLAPAFIRKKAVDCARKSGVIGGMIVIHPWRRCCSRCGRHMSDHYRGFNICPDCGSDGCKWYFSPHFHIVGYGWIHSERRREVTEKTGYVIVNFGVRKSVFATIHYQLSHCGVQDSRLSSRGRKSRPHTVVWFGCCSYRKLKIPKYQLRSRRCPVCQQKLKRVFYEKSDNELRSMEKGMNLVSYDGWKYKVRVYSGSEDF